MSEMSARWRYSWLFALKVGGISGLVMALITDFFFSLAPIGMWLFLIALSILLVTSIVVGLQPTSPPIEQRGLWFAPFGLSLFLFFLIQLISYIASESADGSMGYLAAMVPGIDSVQAAVGLSPRR